MTLASFDLPEGGGLAFLDDFPSDGVAFALRHTEGGPAPDLSLPEARFPLRLSSFRRAGSATVAGAPGPRWLPFAANGWEFLADVRWDRVGRVLVHPRPRREGAGPLELLVTKVGQDGHLLVTTSAWTHANARMARDLWPAWRPGHARSTRGATSAAVVDDGDGRESAVRLMFPGSSASARDAGCERRI